MLDGSCSRSCTPRSAIPTSIPQSAGGLSCPRSHAPCDCAASAQRTEGLTPLESVHDAFSIIELQRKFLQSGRPYRMKSGRLTGIMPEEANWT